MHISFTGCPDSNHTRSSPVKITGNNGRKHNRGGFNSRNVECFSAPVDSFLNDDFDFDSNFALFDKENFYEELDAMGENRPKRQGPRNLRFDENILERRESEEGKRIICPDTTGKWYHTGKYFLISSIVGRLFVKEENFVIFCSYGMNMNNCLKDFLLQHCICE